jgi:hypothetical protein
MRWVVAVLVLGGCGSDPPSLLDPDPDFAPAATITVFEASNRGFQTRGARAAIVDPDEPLESEIARAGNCRLLVFEEDTCSPPCDEGQGVCVDDACVTPTLHSAGVITIDGLAVPVTLTPNGNAVYGQDQSGLPEDLFADDASLAASAPGADRAGFAVDTRGVATVAPELDVDQITLLEETDTVVRWTPATPDLARVRVQLRSNSDGATLPSNARIECEGPDTGSLRVPAELAAMFPKMPRRPVCPDPYCPPSTLTRYRRATVDTDDGEVSFEAASESSFILVH